MKFLLWRHAEAEIGENNDLIRPLTPKGHRQAEQAARKIQTLLTEQAFIVVSEATRSIQTAHYLQRPTQTQPEINPDAQAADLLKILLNYQNDDVVVWVGHQPWIGDLAGFLLTNTWAQHGVWFKKAAFWQFDLRHDNGVWQSKLRRVYCV